MDGGTLFYIVISVALLQTYWTDLQTVFKKLFGFLVKINGSHKVILITLQLPLNNTFWF